MTSDNLIIEELQRRILKLERRLDFVNVQEINQFSNIYLYGDVASLRTRRDSNINFTEHWDVTALPAGWAWDTVTFTTPPTVAYGGSHLAVGFGASAGEAGFLYRSLTPTQSPLLMATLASTTANWGVGVRVDDGTDNNYCEALLAVRTSAPSEFGVRTYYRTGGGTATIVNDTGTWYLPHLVVLRLSLEGTLWSNWSCRPIIYLPWQVYGNAWKSVITTGLTWTATRVGLVFRDGGSTSTWERSYVDAAYIT